MNMDEQKLSALKSISRLMTELAQIIGINKRNKAGIYFIPASKLITL